MNTQEVYKSLNNPVWWELLTNSELLREVRLAAGDVSFFNAAEGPAWYSEAVGRGNAVRRLSKLCQIAVERGLAAIVNETLKTGKYLL